MVYLVNRLADEVGVGGVYSLYLNRICEGKENNGTGGAMVQRCLSYSDTASGTFASSTTSPRMMHLLNLP
jgi:hypothetical protein